MIKDDDNFGDPSLHHLKIIEKIDSYSDTGKWRLTALLRLTDYVVIHDIPGVIAECGVWRGGSMFYDDDLEICDWCLVPKDKTA